jgi:hypothetical protein
MEHQNKPVLSLLNIITTFTPAVNRVESIRIMPYHYRLKQLLVAVI